MTPDQIANWRRILRPIFGTYALLMPVAQIEAIREQMQGAIDRAFGKSCGS